MIVWQAGAELSRQAEMQSERDISRQAGKRVDRQAGERQACRGDGQVCRQEGRETGRSSIYKNNFCVDGVFYYFTLERSQLE